MSRLPRLSTASGYRVLRSGVYESEFAGTQYIDPTYATGTAFEQKHTLIQAGQSVFGGSGPSVASIKALGGPSPYPLMLLYVNCGLIFNTPVSAAIADAAYARSSNDPTKYMHDNGASTFAMEPSSQAWQDYIFTNTAAGWNTGGYDGIFLDNIGYTVPSGETECDNAGTATTYGAAHVGATAPLNPMTGVAYTRASYITAARHLVSCLRSRWQAAGLNPILMCNGIGDSTRYWDTTNSPVAPTSALLDVVDAACAEIWLRSAATAATSFPTESASLGTKSWENDVNLLFDAGAHGKAIGAATKCWNAADSGPQQDQWHRFALASFLLAANGRHTFTYEGFIGAPSAGTTKRSSGFHTFGAVYPSAYDTDLGLPLQTFTAAAQARRTGTPGSGASVYSRAFAKGFVVVNPSSGSDSITLPTSPTGAWKPLATAFAPSGTGSSLTGSFTVAQNEAAILIPA